MRVDDVAGNMCVALPPPRPPLARGSRRAAPPQAKAHSVSVTASCPHPRLHSRTRPLPMSIPEVPAPPSCPRLLTSPETSPSM